MRIEVASGTPEVRVATITATGTATASPDSTTNTTFVAYSAPTTCVDNVAGSVFCSQVAARACVGVAKIAVMSAGNQTTYQWKVLPNFLTSAGSSCPTKATTELVGSVATRVGNCPTGTAAVATASAMTALLVAAGFASMHSRDE